MAKSIDASSKDLLNYDPIAWLKLTKSVPEGAEVAVRDTDLSTITASSDKVFEITEVEVNRYLIIEFQAQKDLALIGNCYLRETAFRRKMNALVVDTFIIYAHPSAIPEGITLGKHEVQHAHSPNSIYHYQVVKLWELNKEDLLQGGPAVAPPAVLTDIPKAELPQLLESILTVISTIKSEEIRDQIWSATFFLAGVKYRDVGFLNELFSGRAHMENSVTYQYVLDKGVDIGVLKATRQNLIEFCHDRFPDMPTSVDELIQSINDEKLLHQALRKLFNGASLADIEGLLTAKT